MVQSANGLWKDYRFLTREMASFLGKQDMDMFYSLQEQRERLQAMIEERKDYEFLRSDEGREMAREVQVAEERMRGSLRLEMAKMKQRRQVSKAYQIAALTQPGMRANHLG